MSFKSKAVALGIAALGASALAGAGATAETGGHFIAGADHTRVGGREEGTHFLHFSAAGGTPIGCYNSAYLGTMTSATATEIAIAPSWTGCYTTTEPEKTFDVEENGCTFLFTIGKSPAAHNTAHLKCPVGVPGIDIKHPACTIRVPPQTVSGVSYKAVDATPDLVTLESTVASIQAQFEGGVCVFLGTTQTAAMSGSVKVVAYDSTGKQVEFTATG